MMADFNRYVVTVEVETVRADHSMTEEATFSVAAVDEDTIRSAIPLNHIPYVHDYEIVNVKKQND